MVFARLICHPSTLQSAFRSDRKGRRALPKAGRKSVISTAMGFTESYSLWLMPKGPLTEQLQSEIDALAATVPDAPRFAPHVTLLGGVEKPLEEVLQLAEKLAGELQHYRITFDHVSYGSIFHQCVYILCKKEPATMAAGAATRAAYGLDPHSTYMPHLSLLYSDIPQQERQSLAAALQAKLLEGPDGLPGDGFEVGGIAVWRTPVEDKSLASWELVKEIPLAAQN